MSNMGVAAGAAPLSAGQVNALELPDDLRIPLHGLQADAGYLIGRVAADSSAAGLILQSLETRLSQVAEAAYRLNGARADLLETTKSLVEVDDDCVALSGAEVRSRLDRARDLIAKTEDKACASKSGSAENAAARIARLKEVNAKLVEALTEKLAADDAMLAFLLAARPEAIGEDEWSRQHNERSARGRAATAGMLAALAAAKEQQQ